MCVMTNICCLPFYRVLEEDRACQRRPRKWGWRMSQVTQVSVAEQPAPASLKLLLLGKSLDQVWRLYQSPAETRAVAGACTTLLYFTLCLVFNGVVVEANNLVENKHIKSQCFQPLE